MFPAQHPTPQGVRISMQQRAVLNYAASRLAQHLCTLDIEQVRRWAQQGTELVGLLPADFDLNTAAQGIGLVTKNATARRAAIAALEGMGPAHWDVLLHLVDDIAESVRRSSTDPDQRDSADYLQDMVGVFLAGESHGSPWYYLQMEHMRDRLVAKLRE